MAVNDIYKVTFKYTWTPADGIAGGAVDCTNVHFYRQSSGATVAALSLRVALVTLYNNLRDVAPPFITFTGIDVVNVKTPTDYYNAVLNAVGLRVVTTQQMPSYVALQYVSSRAQPGTRSARKRYPFLVEEDCAGNFLTGAFSTNTEVQDVKDNLGAVITNETETFQPVVVKKPITLGVNPTVSYQIPFYGVSSKIATQNSRKD